jgi:hypothetical protein
MQLATYESSKPSADVSSAPGMYLPIYPVSAIGEARPNYLLILPWNLKSEIVGDRSPTPALEVARW